MEHAITSSGEGERGEEVVRLLLISRIVEVSVNIRALLLLPRPPVENQLIVCCAVVAFRPIKDPVTSNLYNK